MKKITKKLALNKDTVRRLAEPDLLGARGGYIDPTIYVCDTAGPACTSQGRTCFNSCGFC